MIKRITVNNFRCFNEINIDSLRQINLFSGKNNAGKTSLLEAIYSITNTSGPNLIENIKIVRKLFDYKLSDLEIFQSLTYKKNGEKIEIGASFSNYKNPYVKFIFNDSKTFRFIVNPTEGHDVISNMDINFNSVFLLERKEQLPNLGNITALYDQAEISGMKNVFLEAVKIIDNEIEEIRTFSTYPNALFYKKGEDSNYYLIDYLGDAAKKIIIIIANIVFHFVHDNNTEKILLIDEIENGLHFSVLTEFWRILIKLCLKYNIQLFATTHSKEMLEAYCNLNSEFITDLAYFELVKNYGDDIISINHSLDLLEYEIQKDVNVRG